MSAMPAGGLANCRARGVNTITQGPSWVAAKRFPLSTRQLCMLGVRQHGAWGPCCGVTDAMLARACRREACWRTAPAAWVSPKHTQACTVSLSCGRAHQTAQCGAQRPSGLQAQATGGGKRQAIAPPGCADASCQLLSGEPRPSAVHRAPWPVALRFCGNACVAAAQEQLFTPSRRRGSRPEARVPCVALDLDGAVSGSHSRRPSLWHGLLQVQHLSWAGRFAGGAPGFPSTRRRMVPTGARPPARPTAPGGILPPGNASLRTGARVGPPYAAV